MGHKKERANESAGGLHVGERGGSWREWVSWLHLRERGGGGEAMGHRNEPIKGYKV
jgi:hypothetical protein